MIKTISINYTTKDFFGNDKLNVDVIDYGIDSNVVSRVCRAVVSGKAHAAHFTYENGQIDGILKDYDDDGDQITLRHYESEWSCDVVKTTIKEFKKKVKAAL